MHCVSCLPLDFTLAADRYRTCPLSCFNNELIAVIDGSGSTVAMYNDPTNFPFQESWVLIAQVSSWRSPKHQRKKSPGLSDAYAVSIYWGRHAEHP